VKKNVEFRQLTLNDVEVLEKRFPQPESISHKERLLIQSQTGRSIYGYFVNGALITLGQIKRPSAPVSASVDVEYSPEICSIYVVPEARGQRYAYNMIMRLEKIVAKQGYKHAHLTVAPDNEIARRLYEKLGFQLNNHLIQPVITNRPKLYYTKKL
jgi:ribosomal protein S18 acetylase RimI-like enzyme